MASVLTPAIASWVESHVGAHLVDVSRLSGGWTSTMLALRDASGGDWVLRCMTEEPWRTHGAALVTRERVVQQFLAGTSMPAPVSVAADPTGRRTGHPSHLMSRLPGSLVLDRGDNELLGALASTLATIHKLTPSQRPRAFQSWAPEAKRVVPPWSRRPMLWKRAFDLLEDEPDYDGVFLHRDFHLGNVLWRNGQITGIVDWVETSWGPAWLDVAHCRTNLAMLHGPEAAERFAVEYGRHSNRFDHPHRRHWDVMDVVGFLPDPVKVVQPWRDNGIAVTDAMARARLEHHLSEVLAG